MDNYKPLPTIIGLLGIALLITVLVFVRIPAKYSYDIPLENSPTVGFLLAAWCYIVAFGASYIALEPITSQKEMKFLKGVINYAC